MTKRNYNNKIAKSLMTITLGVALSVTALTGCGKTEVSSESVVTATDAASDTDAVKKAEEIEKTSTEKATEKSDEKATEKATEKAAEKATTEASESKADKSVSSGGNAANSSNKSTSDKNTDKKTSGESTSGSKSSESKSSGKSSGNSPDSTQTAAEVTATTQVPATTQAPATTEAVTEATTAHEHHWVRTASKEETHVICNGCGADLTILGETSSEHGRRIEADPNSTDYMRGACGSSHDIAYITWEKFFCDVPTGVNHGVCGATYENTYPSYR